MVAEGGVGMRVMFVLCFEEGRWVVVFLGEQAEDSLLVQERRCEADPSLGGER